MNKLLFILSLLISVSCTSSGKFEARDITGVSITPMLEDSMSVRAIEIVSGKTLWFADDRGRYGYFDYKGSPVIDSVSYDTIVPHFRAIATNDNDVFLLGIGSPALLYKVEENGGAELVYRETHERAFYDAMKFWNEREGIAIGDPTESGCLSVLVTRNGGNSWSRIPCDKLPLAVEGEAAFAASNTNIDIIGDRTWIISGGLRSRVFYSPDKGNSWEVYNVPVVQGEPTLGMYSVDFWDKNTGIAIGGDYTRPEYNTANKAVTTDGGKSWKLVASKKPPGYRSCIQYIPGREGKEVIAVGFEGISFSRNGGSTWKPVSSEGFYTIRFLNDSVAYAAGKGKIAKLVLKQQKLP
ncbi:oxidoreductase [Sinomicrobium pectinilyticum]|uniref:Oxidoreductase n=1 Tax=Sinomicrobium pectinilyticum TaxID=1084421 RepID=A0A3N0ETL6_SINP1|nr:oxidoreductase [Sinomicrobium pectinilyticum]RNL91097.1 oxidoreductase [Sinomicrobium pectinilyticum]